MKTKLIFSTETMDMDHWTELPVLPRLNEWLNVKELLKVEEFVKIKQSTMCWSGTRGTVQSVEYRHDSNGFYPEVFVWCED
jgi:hypothetical protein